MDGIRCMPLDKVYMGLDIGLDIGLDMLIVNSTRYYANVWYCCDWNSLVWFYYYLNKYCEQWFCCCCYSTDAQLYLECNRLIRTVWTAVSHTLDVLRGCLGNTLLRIYIYFFSKFSISFRSAWFNSIKYQINTFTFPTFVLIVRSGFLFFFSCQTLFCIVFFLLSL